MYSCGTSLRRSEFASCFPRADVLVRNMLRNLKGFGEVRGLPGSTENLVANRGDLREKRQFRNFALSIPDEVGYRTHLLK